MCEVIFRIMENIISGAIVAGVVTFFIGKKLEDYKNKEIIRQKAILIADLLSEWCSNPEDKKRLNKLTWEAFIWLPKDIAIKLSNCLSHNDNSPTTKEIIAEVRKIVLGENEKICANKIIHFD